MRVSSGNVVSRLVVVLGCTWFYSSWAVYASAISGSRSSSSESAKQNDNSASGDVQKGQHVICQESRKQGPSLVTGPRKSIKIFIYFCY